jgi:DNA-binding beta-propeller fold protein YncE
MPAHSQTVTATLPAGSSPGAVAVNPVTNKIYVVDIFQSGKNVTVIDGETNKTTMVAGGAATSRSQ